MSEGAASSFLKVGLASRGVPKMKNFDYFALFVHPIVDAHRGVKHLAHSAPLVDRCADMREVG